MNGTKQLYGGLGFASGSDLRLQKIRQTVEFSLKKRGLEAEIGVDLVARKVQFIADECSITLEFSEPLLGASKNHPDVNIGAENRAKAGPENTALHVEIALSDCLNDDPKTLLAFLMIDLVRAHYPVCVEWLKPTAQLRAEDFLSIFDIDLTGHVVSPRRAAPEVGRPLCLGPGRRTCQSDRRHPCRISERSPNKRSGLARCTSRTGRSIQAAACQ